MPPKGRKKVAAVAKIHDAELDLELPPVEKILEEKMAAAKSGRGRKKAVAAEIEEKQVDEAPVKKNGVAVNGNGDISGKESARDEATVKSNGGVLIDEVESEAGEVKKTAPAKRGRKNAVKSEDNEEESRDERAEMEKEKVEPAKRGRKKVLRSEEIDEETKDEGAEMEKEPENAKSGRKKAKVVEEVAEKEQPVKATRGRKKTADENDIEENGEKPEVVIDESQSSSKAPAKGRGRKKAVDEAEMKQNGEKPKDDIAEEKSEVKIPAKSRGRKKAEVVVSVKEIDEEETAVKVAAKTRGRKAKVDEVAIEESNEEEPKEEQSLKSPAKSQGRKKSEVEEIMIEEESEEETSAKAPAKSRGRKKAEVVIEDTKKVTARRGKGKAEVADEKETDNVPEKKAEAADEETVPRASRKKPEATIPPVGKRGRKRAVAEDLVKDIKRSKAEMEMDEESEGSLGKEQEVRVVIERDPALDEMAKKKKLSDQMDVEEVPVKTAVGKAGSGRKRANQSTEETKPSKVQKEDPPKGKSGQKKAQIPDVSALDFSSDAKTKDGELWNLKIASWNVNGVRAWLEKNGMSYLHHEDPDVLCIQETKCADDKLPEELQVKGYHCHWLAGDKDGYSGVGLISKQKPIEITDGIGMEEHDTEGRVITAEYEEFYLVNTYVPNAGRGLVRLDYRKKWDADFRAYLKQLDSKKPVILCGDLNVAHEEIDLANPKTNKKNAGFTQEERDGFSALLKEGFVDTFRQLYPTAKSAYTFWTYMMNARAKNVGWRIDYFVVSERFQDHVCDSVIRKDVFGSDHCPIGLLLNV